MSRNTVFSWNTNKSIYDKKNRFDGKFEAFFLCLIGIVFNKNTKDRFIGVFMRKIFKFLIIICFASILFVPNTAFAEEKNFYLGGYAAGFSLDTKGAEVVGVCDVITNFGSVSPAKDAKIIAGDVILSIGEKTTDSANDIADAIKDGQKKIAVIERDGLTASTEITPVKDINGDYKIGVFIRDNIKGIGTITYISGNRFAALGHPVLRSDGQLIKLNGGKLYDCAVVGCNRGVRGKAGELRGVFIAKKEIGIVFDNELTGVYGELNSDFDYKELKPIETGEGKAGDASIYSTVNGEGVNEYKISIIKVDKYNNSNKNFVIKITDEKLIKETGGIVQGMSGSPIVQDGKLVGAVTHVFINDPTRGFAISIDNMINE